ncbi:MAG: LysE family translocator [Firmicutes bacterium]|nr:LysE family translocator [Bacillota bacterium]
MFGITMPHLAAFVVIAVAVIVIPGPSVLFVVSRALSNGRRVAWLSVLGNTAGEYIQVVVVAFGLGALAEQSLGLFTVLKLAGGLYLVYLGVKTFRERGQFVAQASGEQKRFRHPFIEGAIVGVTNPKTVVFLASILPQFVTLSAGHVAAQILFLGLIFSAIAVVSDSAWALLAGVARNWFARSPRRLAMMGGAGGLAITAIGLGLLVSGRRT